MGPAGPFFFAGCFMLTRKILLFLSLVFLGVVGWILFFEAMARLIEVYLRLLNFTPSKVSFYADSLRHGAEVTLKVTVISSIVGFAVGLVAGIAKLSKNPVFRLPATFYVWLVRGTPLLVQILFAYNGLPYLLAPVWEKLQPYGFPPIEDVLTDYWAAFIALTFNVGAYNAEVIRAGIQAVSKGQWEAAQSLGLSQAQVMRYIVIPQAIRIVIPPLVNNIIALLKDSSLAYVIGLYELVMAGQRIISATFRPVPIYLAVAAVYLLLTTLLTFFTDWAERRLRAQA